MGLPLLPGQLTTGAPSGACSTAAPACNEPLGALPIIFPTTK